MANSLTSYLVALLVFTASAQAQAQPQPTPAEQSKHPGVFGFAFNFKQPPPELLLGVCGVAPGFPAERGGLKLNDSITAIDSKADFKNAFEVYRYIFARSAGESLQLRVLREGKPLNIMVTAAVATNEQEEAKRRTLERARQAALHPESQPQ